MQGPVKAIFSATLSIAVDANLPSFVLNPQRSVTFLPPRQCFRRGETSSRIALAIPAGLTRAPEQAMRNDDPSPRIDRCRRLRKICRAGRSWVDEDSDVNQ